MILKQSTLYTRQFLMVLSSDHVTGATGKSPVVKLGKAGASGTTAANSPATEVDSSNLPGVYKIILTAADTASIGDLWIAATASSCDSTDICDQVQVQVFPDLLINGIGQPSIASNIKQNTALSGFMFPMTSATTGQPTTGLIITAQRSLGGAGFAPCANSVTELSNGIYKIDLAAADLNSSTVMLRFTAGNANDQDILLITQP